MSNAPLFQNMDDQEKAYAPQELPDGSHGAVRAAADDGRTANQTDATATIVPAAAMGATGGVSSTSNPGLGAIAINTAHDERADPDSDDR